MDSAPCRILIAEDSPSNSLLLATLLKRQGHEVLTADNGSAAIESYRHERPALVLLDVSQVLFDGFEVARRIRALAGDVFVPIVFLTASQDPAFLARCLEDGGDDFLIKPYNSTVLRAKINAFRRMGEMNQLVLRQRDEIVRHNRHLLQEQEIAKRVFDKVAHAGALDLPNIRYVLSPLAVFNGDVMLASAGPSGNLIVLLGDFTGHGLAAAIGAMPLAQTFYSMVAKGFHVRDIVREINAKLYDILPVGVFCCAAAVDFDFAESTLQVWNGGLPDGLLYRGSGEIWRLPSKHLPLGIKPGKQFNDAVEVLETRPGDRLYLWSDGIQEATDARGEMFGEQRLLNVFHANRQPERLFDEINRTLKNFVGSHTQADDVSLVEIGVVARDRFAGMAPAHQELAAHGPVQWQMSFELFADSLRNTNPLPLLLHNLMEVPGLRPRSGQLYTALAELYSNALEHGVLQLDSTLKHSAAGFASYYQQRGQSLQNLADGQIRFDLNYRGNDNGGLLSITVTDSGCGFDVEKILQRRRSGDGYFGRGVALLQKIGQRLHFDPPGNKVCLEYVWGHWSQDAADENGPVTAALSDQGINNQG